MDTRKENRELYPPATIALLLCGLKHILKVNKVPFLILDKEHLRFCDLFNTIDTMCSELHRKGVGLQQKQGKVMGR